MSRPATRATSSAAAAPDAATTLTPARRSTSLTQEEEARAAELEAQILAEERAAENTQRRNRDRDRDRAEPRVRETVPLAVKASSEYAYVRRDIVRIMVIGAIMLLVLAVLHILINVAGVIQV